MGRMFGTDGVRGIANKELTCELALKIGAAGAYVIASDVHRPRILIGSDTRRSADMLCSALIAGICSVGGDAIMLGEIPTPAMAYLVRCYGADAAVMVSASHNSMEYNGIKWFDSNGFKLKDSVEDRIEAIIKENIMLPMPTGEGVGHMMSAKRARDEYIEFLKEASTADTLAGIKIALDCANGASSGIAREVFEGLGATVFAYEDEPDGCNINDRCGSTYPERLRQIMTELDADVGFAFDGDADRVIAFDEYGNIVDGDRIMGICAADMKREGTLANNMLVMTVMSNLGLKKYMNKLGIDYAETKVGDRYVLEKMLEGGYLIGGEQSGHIIFLDKNTTGDGMLTAVKVLNVLKKSGKSMSELAREIDIYPQVLVNVMLDKDVMSEALDDPDFISENKRISSTLGDNGRVLIRKSGTEPLIRIMVEGQDQSEIETLALRAANVLTAKYNGRIKEKR